MYRNIALMIGLLVCLAPLAQAQEVLIAEFPLGVGGTVSDGFFEPYYPQLREVAAQLRQDPRLRAVIVGSADGARYATDNDAKNPGLSLGRAHALRNVLVQKLGVDSTQLLIQTADAGAKGGQYRSASVRIAPELTRIELPPMTPPQPAAAQEPIPVVTEYRHSIVENMGFRFGGGASSSPFGGVPIVSGAVTWNRLVYFEGIFGHTFWSDSFPFEGEKLSTWRRLVSGRVTAYPWKGKPVGLTAGWLRIEEISQSYYEYVKLSEGPVVGIEVMPLSYASVAALYNPARQRIAGDRISRSKGGQFVISVTLHTLLGGTR